MKFLDYLRHQTPFIPGTVTSAKGDGNTRIHVRPSIPLPMIDGTTSDTFLAQTKGPSGLHLGDNVCFRWLNPGIQTLHPETKAPQLPYASSLTAIDEKARRELEVVLMSVAAVDSWMESSQDDGEPNFVDADPASAQAIAYRLLWEARDLVKDEAEVKKSISDAKAQFEKLQSSASLLEKREENLAQAEAALAPLRAFAAAIQLDSPEPRHRVADGPAVEATLAQVDGAIGRYATDFTRQTAILALLVSALKGRILLLDGPVGTGKSSLAESMASAMGGDSGVIPIRPAWIEPTDLLGFFDPASRVFRPGPFVDALAHPVLDRLNVVVFDEMNIARIENYAADVLSRMERIADAYQNKEIPKGILAWSPAEWQALKAEWEVLMQISSPTPEIAHRVSQLKHTLRCPPSIIPVDGTVLVGTLNTDDSTYDVSPKVIDRSFVVSFPTADLRAEDVPSTARRHGISIANLREFVSAHRHQNQNVMWARLLDLWDQETMARLGVPYSHRIAADFECFTTLGAYLDVAEEELVAMFAFSRVLPRIRFFKDDSRTELALAKLASLRQIRHTSGAALDRGWDYAFDRLELQCTNERVQTVRFWSSEFG